MKKRLLAICAMFALFTGSAAALGAYHRTITVEYGVNINVDGQIPAFTDESGKPVQPFVFEGTTYVPLRAVSESLGANTSFDAKTNTVMLTDDYYYATDLLHMMQATMYRIHIEGLGLQANLTQSTAEKTAAKAAFNDLTAQYTAIKDELHSLVEAKNLYVGYINKKCADDFTGLYSAYQKMYKQYIKYCDTPSVAYERSALASFEEMIIPYSNCQKGIESFYN